MIQKCPKCGTWAEGKTVIIKQHGDVVLHCICSPFWSVSLKLSSFQCEKCGNKWEVNENQINESNKEVETRSLRETLREISCNPVKERTQLNSLIGTVKQKINEGGSKNIILQLLNILAVASCYANDYITAESCINESLEICDNPNSHVVRGIIKYRSNKYSDPLQLYSILSDLVSVSLEERDENGYFPESYIRKIYDDVLEAYANGFMNIKPLQRKFVVLKDKIDRVSEEIKVLPISANVPGMLFSDGRPCADKLYIQHPLKSNKYFPVEEYDFDIFKDKLYEFKWIMESLGAKHIEITDRNENSDRHSLQKGREYDLEGGVKGFKGKGSYGNESDSGAYESLYQDLQESNDFTISGKPALPPEEDLVWYQKNEEWQRQVKSRLAGRLVHHSFKFSTESSESLSEREKNKIEAEMRYLTCSGKVSYEGSDQFSFKKSDAHNWSVDVEFFPLSAYNKFS
jgi:hypothetical protein